MQYHKGQACAAFSQRRIRNQSTGVQAQGLATEQAAQASKLKQGLSDLVCNDSTAWGAMPKEKRTSIQ